MASCEDRDQNKRNQLVVDAINVGTWEWNVQTGEADFNERWADIVGYTLDELRPLSITTWLSLAHPVDLERSQQALEQHFAGKDAFYEVEARMKHKLGHWVWVLDRGKVVRWSDDGKPLLMYGAHLDISSRKAKEFELSQSEERFRALIDVTSQIVWSSNAQGALEEIDPSWSSYTGQSLEDACGEGFRNAIHPDDRDDLLARWDSAVAAGLPADIGLFRLHHVSGQWRWNISRTTPVHNNEGEIISWIGMCTDVHDQHEYKIQLEESKQDLENKIKLRTSELAKAKLEAENANHAKSQFISNISHELRTPLAALIGYGRILQSAKLDKTARDQLIRLNKAGDMLFSLINDVLDFTKLEARELQLSPETFNLRHKLLGLVSIMGISADEKGLRLILEPLPPKLARYYVGDPVRLRQILFNLIGNAIKFTEQGEVRIRVSLPDATGSDKHRVRFEVIDTGIGIAPKDIPKLFSRFSQVDDSNTRQHYGTGLGLAIVKELAQLMGGHAGLESAVGIGSTFWVEIDLTLPPVASPPPVIETAPDTDAILPSLEGVRILAVDDSDLILDVIDVILSATGAIVECCPDGQQALDRLRDPHHNFDIILMDIQMPVMDGNETVKHIRRDKNICHLPVIAMTAGATQTEREESLAAGVNEYITKPFEPEHLVHIIRQTLSSQHPLSISNGKAKI